MESFVVSDPTDTIFATLLQLTRRARQAEGLAELEFLLVNETHELVPFRQAVLWTQHVGVKSLSGVVSPESNAPYVQWIESWCKRTPVGEQLIVTDLRTLTSDDECVDWEDWLPAYLLEIPLPACGRFPGGKLLLARDVIFEQAELSILQEWVDSWLFAYRFHTPHRWWQSLQAQNRNNSKRKWQWRAGIFIAVILISIFPVRLTVLAPAELIPLAPAVISAPLDGVIERVSVQPNQRVQLGQSLFVFDRVSLASRLLVAERTLITVKAEYRQHAQRALFEEESRAKLAVLQSKVDEKLVDVAYLRQLNERGIVTSPREGIVLFDDPNLWVGRPVVTGERVMLVADENKVQLEAWLSPADGIALSPGSLVIFYLASDPLEPIKAKIEYLAHQAELRPEGHYAYRIRASLLNAGERKVPRVGMKGTAKLIGEDVALIYWILRRPWAAIRNGIGL